MPRGKRGEGGIAWSDTHNRYRARIVVDGKRHDIYGPKGDRSRTARMGLEERLASLQRKYSKDTLNAHIDAYIARADLRKNTVAIYKTAAKHVAGLSVGAMRIDVITPKDVRDGIAKIDGPHIRAKAYSLVRRVLQVAMEHDEIPSNPAARTQRPTVERVEHPVWTPEETLRFLKAATGHPLYAMFLLALTSTMGPAELFGLRREDVHLDGGYLVVQRDLEDVAGHLSLGPTKTKSRRRRIDLPAVTIDALRAHMEANRTALVFTSPKGAMLRRSHVRRRVWLPLIEKAKVTVIRMYDLRHTANALMGRLGVSVHAASRRMGHASPSMTLDVYGHLYDSEGREAADKLDAFFSNGVRERGTAITDSIPHTSKKAR